MNPIFTDAQLVAFLDGTIADAALVAAIETAINADPALAVRVEALALRDDPTALAVRDAFAPVLAAQVPPHLVQILDPPPTAKVVDLTTARAKAGGARLPVPANDTGGSWRWPQFGAMAASLALGVLIGGPVLTEGSGAGEKGLVMASADIDAMLDTAPSGQAVDLAALGRGEVVLTFRSTDGQLCRQFMVAGKAGTSDALACSQGAGKGWQIEAFGRRQAPTGEMKLAAGDAAPAVVAAVDAMIGSDPLIGQDETAELAKQ